MSVASMPPQPSSRPQALNFNSSSFKDRIKPTLSPHPSNHDLVDGLWCYRLIPANTLTRDWIFLIFPKNKPPLSKRQVSYYIPRMSSHHDSLISPSTDKVTSFQHKPKSSLIKLDGLNIGPFPECFVWLGFPQPTLQGASNTTSTSSAPLWTPSICEGASPDRGYSMGLWIWVNFAWDVRRVRAAQRTLPILAICPMRPEWFGKQMEFYGPLGLKPLST